MVVAQPTALNPQPKLSQTERQEQLEKLLQKLDES